MSASDPCGLGLDPELSADCVHCGLCLETCPTFRETGEEAESPRGRILLARGLALGRWDATADVLGPLDRCLGCRACETVCPSGVAYGHLLEVTRATVRRAGAPPRSRLEQFLIRHVLWRGTFLARAAGIYRALGLWRLAARLARAPGISPDWRRRLRLLPRPESPGGPMPAASVAGGPPVWLLRGCVARALYPETERAMVRLLQAAGYRVGRLHRPACCGALAAHAGEGALAAGMAAGAVRELSAEGWIVPTAAGCGAHLRGLENALPAAAAAGARSIAERVRDLSELLVDAPRPLSFLAGPSPRVVFQDPCHLRHGQAVTAPPRRLLAAAGADLVEADEADLCCGSAGTYNLAEPAMAERLGRRKAAVLRATGAERVVTANPGCAIQLAAYLDPGTPVVPLARFLAERLAPDGSAVP